LFFQQKIIIFGFYYNFEKLNPPPSIFVSPLNIQNFFKKKFESLLIDSSNFNEFLFLIFDEINSIKEEHVF